MAEKEEREYHCGFCKNSFTRVVGRTMHNSRKDGSFGKMRHTSSQVKCPQCGNFVKTWE